MGVTVRTSKKLRRLRVRRGTSPKIYFSVAETAEDPAPAAFTRVQE